MPRESYQTGGLTLFAVMEDSPEDDWNALLKRPKTLLLEDGVYVVSQALLRLGFGRATSIVSRFIQH